MRYSRLSRYKIKKIIEYFSEDITASSAAKILKLNRKTINNYTNSPMKNKRIKHPEWKKNQIVIMDNASIHKSPKIREAIENAGCSLVYQPPYSPDLNPIEHFWSYLKRKIGALKQKFESIFDAIQYILLN